MAYTWTTLNAAVAAALAVDVTDADFIALAPTIYDDAEQRCYRELDLLTASVNIPGTLTANSRNFTLPTTYGHVLVVDALNVYSAPGVRFNPPVRMVTRDVIDYLWPNEAAPTAGSFPVLAARPDDLTLLVAPAPAQAYNVEVIATIRPAPISATNTTTFLSMYLSDVFFAAIMADANGVILRNFGAQGENTAQAVSWESKYAMLRDSASKEELRKIFVTNTALPASAKA
jgi:hypothetical protein